MSEAFILGSDAYTNGVKAVKALRAFAALRSSTPSLGLAVYLVIDVDPTTQLPPKDYVPRIIPIKHPLAKLGEKSVLLITKDPSTAYRRALTDPRAPTADAFANIYSLTKVRALVRDTGKATRLFKEHDLVVADVRVHKLLPPILGPRFYAKNKKIPFLIQMARPRPQDDLPSGSPLKGKDDRCDPKYVYKQLQHITSDTSFRPPRGSCINVMVGYTTWDPETVLENVNDVLTYLVLEKNKPVGGFIRQISNISAAHLKTSDSASMPIIASAKPAPALDNNDSDFEF